MWSRNKQAEFGFVGSKSESVRHWLKQNFELVRYWKTKKEVGRKTGGVLPSVFWSMKQIIRTKKPTYCYRIYSCHSFLERNLQSVYRPYEMPHGYARLSRPSANSQVWASARTFCRPFRVPWTRRISRRHSSQSLCDRTSRCDRNSGARTDARNRRGVP